MPEQSDRDEKARERLIIVGPWTGLNGVDEAFKKIPSMFTS